jgi:hypothetical protein
MSFTRFHDDPYRIKKQLEESSFIGRYQLNTPGNGLDLPFMEDPQIRLQRWGANLRTNTVNLESDLFGITRPLNRDLEEINSYKKHQIPTSPVTYRDAKPIVNESRATNPAWMYRDIDYNRWESPFLNPQNGLEKPFNENIQTRILEKDHYVPTVPVVAGIDNYYLTGVSNGIGHTYSK